MQNKFTIIIKKLQQQITSKKFWFFCSKELLKKIAKNKLVLGIILFSLIVGFMSNSFWTKQNWLNIIELNTPIAIVAIGMTLIILTGGIDLSVGSIVAAVGASIFVIHKTGISMSLSIFISIILGTIIGLIQGFLVGIWKMVPFIVTLAGMLIYRGVAIVILKEHSMNAVGNSALVNLSTSKFLGILTQTWILLLIAILLMIVLKFTVFGRNIYAIGGNKKASILSGVNIKLIETSVYLILGFLTSIAAMMYVSNTQSVAPNTGLGIELDVIAMVVLGGTSLSGGSGSIFKTLVGWLILSVLFNALIILGISDSYQKIFSGVIIIFAVYLDKNKINWKKIASKFLKYLKMKKKHVMSKTNTTIKHKKNKHK